MQKKELTCEYSLKLHKSRMHENGPKKIFKCDKCDYTASYKGNLTKHVLYDKHSFKNYKIGAKINFEADSFWLIEECIAQY